MFDATGLPSPGKTEPFLCWLASSVMVVRVGGLRAV